MRYIAVIGLIWNIVLLSLIIAYDEDYIIIVVTSSFLGILYTLFMIIIGLIKSREIKTPIDMAQNLLALQDLKEKGVLDYQEFYKLKSKLLNDYN